MQLPRLLAKLGCFQNVFDIEDWFACVDERQERLAFVELEALLVQRPVEVGQQVGDLVHVVLEPNGEPPLVGGLRQPQVVLDLIVGGQAGAWADGVELVQNSYRAGVTDEFVEPTGIRGVGEAGVEERDAVLLLNFRSDRMRQLTAALTRPDFDGFERARARPVDVVTLTEYEADLPVSVAFSPEHVKPCLAQVLADAGLMQLKVAETEKYAHVTYFFNGGEEAPFEGEDRTLVPSPKVATYDLQPEMSARGVADAVLEGMRSGTYDFILVNFANPDMVGHTGRVSAARCAVEEVDACLGDLLDAIGESPEWVALVTADHGNCEMMIDAEGNVHTAHTTEPVDFVVVDPQGLERHISGPGKLADVAPTVLDLMGIDAPAQMTGASLLTEAAGEDLD